MTFVVAMVVRSAVALIFGSFFSGRYVNDDSTYHLMATQMAADEVHGWDPYTRLLYQITGAFSVPITWLYEIFGPHKIVGQLWTAFTGAAVAAVTVRIAIEGLTRKYALIVGLTVALMPSQVLWSSVVLKDASVWLGLATIAAAVAIGARTSGLRLLALGALIGGALYALGHLRQHTLVIACIALVVASFAGRRDLLPVRVAGALLLAIGIPWIVGIGPGGYDLVANAGSLEERRLGNAAMANSAFIEAHPLPSPPETEALYDQQLELERLLAAQQARLASMQAKESSEGIAEAEEKISQLEQQKADLDEQLSSIPPPLQEETGDPDILHLPRGIEVMLFEPTPWYPGGSPSLKMARAETVLWYPILFLAGVGLATSLRRHLRMLLFPVVVGAGSLILYALTEGNIGTAYRHRGEFVWVAVLLAGLGAVHLLARRQERSDAVGTGPIAS